MIYNSLRLSSEQNTCCYTLSNMSQPSSSDVGSSVSERSPLICNEVIDLTSDTHRIFVICWNVNGFKAQSLKREFVNVLSAIVRYGAPDLNIMNTTNPLDYTGYAVYYDRTRVWLVARISEAIPRYWDMIVCAAVYQVDTNCEGAALVMQWPRVSKVVKAALHFGHKIFSEDVPAGKSVNFERVLRSCMHSDDMYLTAPIVMKSFLGNPDVVDYFDDDYSLCSDLDSNNIIYFWSVCKRNEWKVSNYVNSSRKRKVIDL